MNRSIDTIEDEAARLIARIEAGKCSKAFERELNDWLDADPMHRAVFLRMWRILRKLDALRGKAPPAAVLRPQRIRAPKPIFMRALAIVMAIGIAAGATWLLRGPAVVTSAVDDAPPLSAIYETSIGAEKTVTLADGSSVSINTNTKVIAGLTPIVRKVTLVQGEAKFRVAHDPQRRFEVFVDELLVRATGTEFSVKRVDESRLEVIVTQGRVEIAHPAAKAICGERRTQAVTDLSAGEIAVIDEACVAVRTLSNAELDRLLSWTAGMLVFDGEPLSKAVEELNRYRRRRIVIMDPQLANEPVVATFRTQQIEDVLEVILSTLNARLLPPSSASPNEDRLVGKGWKQR